MPGKKKKAARPRKKAARKSKPKGATAVHSHHTTVHHVHHKPKKKRGRVSGAGMTASQHKSAARLLLEERLGTEYIKRDNARLKRDKRKHAKEIAELKKQIRKLK